MLLQLASIFAYSLSIGVPTPAYYDYSANYVYTDDPAFKLTVVCDGFGTDTVHCKMLPFLAELRTAEQNAYVK